MSNSLGNVHVKCWFHFYYVHKDNIQILKHKWTILVACLNFMLISCKFHNSFMWNDFTWISHEDKFTWNSVGKVHQRWTQNEFQVSILSVQSTLKISLWPYSYDMYTRSFNVHSTAIILDKYHSDYTESWLP